MPSLFSNIRHPLIDCPEMPLPFSKTTPSNLISMGLIDIIGASVAWSASYISTVRSWHWAIFFQWKVGDIESVYSKTLLVFCLKTLLKSLWCKIVAKTSTKNKNVTRSKGGWKFRINICGTSKITSSWWSWQRRTRDRNPTSSLKRH